MSHPHHNCAARDDAAVSLRDYQVELVDKIRTVMRQHRRVLAVAPTGAGKTVIFTFISKAYANSGKKIIIVAHRVEIVTQISKALDKMQVRHGRIWPGNTQTTDNVQVAMVQTLARRVSSVQAPDLIVVDEAHHAVAGQWATITAAWPNARILGVTATPIRLDGRGLGAAFDCLVIGPTMRHLIQRGYLARYDYLNPPQKHDITSVKSGRFGDYSVEELAAVMDKSVITGDAVRTYRQHLDGRPAIAFCVSIQHAEHVAQEFRAAGYRAASVDGTMDTATRADLIASIGDGRLNILTSCQIISEGTDIPSVAGAILLRPTQSLSMYLQSVGRCLRPKPDGSRALIIDHSGNAHIHGMPCDEREWTLANTKRISKSKTGSVSQCEVCYRAFGVSQGWREQAQCGADRPDGCCLRAAEPQPRDINQVDGDLVLTTADEIASVAPRQLSFKEVMKTARTRADLERIAAERGYKPGWVDHAAKAYHVRPS